MTETLLRSITKRQNPPRTVASTRRQELDVRNLFIFWVAAMIWGCALHVSVPCPNLVQDPSFEDGAPRGLNPTDSPWGGEEPPAGVQIMQGSAKDGTQFARMQFVSGTGSECPGCNQSFLFQRIDVTPDTDYLISYWIRGTTLVTSGIQIPFLDDCR